MNGTYKMDFASKTLTLSKAFADAATNPESEEYNIILRFQQDIPNLKIVRKTHKTPTRYKNKVSGEITVRNQFKNLTYKNMERFMNALPKSEEYLKVYNFLRNDAGLVQASAYKTVRDWFMAQFPKFRSNPLFYIKNEPKVIDISSFLEQQEKKDA